MRWACGAAARTRGRVLAGTIVYSTALARPGAVRRGGRPHSYGPRLRVPFDAVGDRPVLADVHPKPLVEAHVHVRHPHQPREPDQVAAPVVEGHSELEHELE